jgi:hypothetical protein
VAQELIEAAKRVTSKRAEGEELSEVESRLLEDPTRETLDRCREQIAEALSTLFEAAAPKAVQNVSIALPAVLSLEDDDQLFADTTGAAKEGSLDGGKTMKKDTQKVRSWGRTTVIEWLAF